MTKKQRDYLVMLSKRKTWNDTMKDDPEVTIEDLVTEDRREYHGGYICGETNLARLLLDDTAWEEDNES